MTASAGVGERRRRESIAVGIIPDVDEAVFMADRCVMMSNGPKAGVGEIMEIDFPRPRDREAVFNDPMFFQYREHLLAFLEQRSHIKAETRIHTKDDLVGYMEKAALADLDQKLTSA